MLAVGALVLCLDVPATPRLAAASVSLVYVGADDCPPCKLWQRGDGDRFRLSATFQQIRYREIRSPALFDVMNDRNWPDDLRGLRDGLGRGVGVPLWIVTADRRVVMTAHGLSEWRTKVLPVLARLR